ncbi:hypothetical protein MSAN_01046200 [Mycena sanguinolenta]|uniref:Uncharacterized protein n=1 Tax=Mycena sanguinolenta TaxID=230812 RepID=A0A8H7D8Y4_9AGAR|nr:hypothetical protein MSAN_01046200 [Mycena sanguinolenta]
MAQAQLNEANIQPPLYPGAILHDNNHPTTQILLASVPPAAIWNLYRVVHDNVHFEHNTYGYWNTALQSILPARRGYQIDPQYPVRRNVHQYSSSQSSIGGTHRNRNAPGRETGIQYPDFLITKCFPMPVGSERQKHILTFIEIKVDSDDVGVFETESAVMGAAKSQVEAYIE